MRDSLLIARDDDALLLLRQGSNESDALPDLSHNLRGVLALDPLKQLGAQLLLHQHGADAQADDGSERPEEVADGGGDGLVLVSRGGNHRDQRGGDADAVSKAGKDDAELGADEGVDWRAGRNEHQRSADKHHQVAAHGEPVVAARLLHQHAAAEGARHASGNGGEKADARLPGAEGVDDLHVERDEEDYRHVRTEGEKVGEHAGKDGAFLDNVWRREGFGGDGVLNEYKGAEEDERDGDGGDGKVVAVAIVADPVETDEERENGEDEDQCAEEIDSS